VVLILSPGPKRRRPDRVNGDSTKEWLHIAFQDMNIVAGNPAFGDSIGENDPFF
jgi:hypothetical protein